MSYMYRMLYHQDAASREEQAAARAVDGMCAQLHTHLAIMHRNEAAHLEAVDATLRQAFGDLDSSVEADDDGTLRVFPISRRGVHGQRSPRSHSSSWPGDMG